MSKKTKRRTLIAGGLASLTALAATLLAKQSKASHLETTQMGDVVSKDDQPLYSAYKVFNNMVFVSGKSATIEGDIKAQTDFVLKEIEKRLLEAGSSLEKLLKVNVFLADIKDYQAMNEVYKGRFGSKPPCRTTVAVAGGIPKNSLIELDCIGYI